MKPGLVPRSLAEHQVCLDETAAAIVGELVGRGRGLVMAIVWAGMDTMVNAIAEVLRIEPPVQRN